MQASEIALEEIRRPETRVFIGALLEAGLTYGEDFVVTMEADPDVPTLPHDTFRFTVTPDALTWKDDPQRAQLFWRACCISLEVTGEPTVCWDCWLSGHREQIVDCLNGDCPTGRVNAWRR